MASRWSKSLGNLLWRTPQGEKHAPIKFVCFDMDGTLTLLNIDFKEMRRRMGIQPHEDLIGCMEDKSPQEKARLNGIIEEVELEARKATKLQPGIHETLQWLHHDAKAFTGIITRNSDEAITHFLELLKIEGAGTHGGVLSHTLSRSFRPYKPDAAPLLHLCERFGVLPESTIMVGDSIDDLLCGKNAGAATCLILNDKNSDLKPQADIVISRLDELPDLLTKPSIQITRL